MTTKCLRKDLLDWSKRHYVEEYEKEAHSIVWPYQVEYKGSINIEGINDSKNAQHANLLYTNCSFSCPNWVNLVNYYLLFCWKYCEFILYLSSHVKWDICFIDDRSLATAFASLCLKVYENTSLWCNDLHPIVYILFALNPKRPLRL